MATVQAPVSRDSVPTSPPGDERSLAEQWRRVGTVAGGVAVITFVVISAADSLTPAQGAVLASLFGPAVACVSIGIHQVLRLRRRTVSADLGLLANIAASLTVTLMLFAQTGLEGWFDLEFGEGATESADRTLDAAFEAANGLQLGLDVAWDVFIGIGTVLFAVNMWRHPKFGRVLAGAGIAIAVPFIALNLALFPDPPEHAGVFDPGPLVGLWYLAATVFLARASRWIATSKRR
jgi:hypothetical protein